MTAAVRGRRPAGLGAAPRCPNRQSCRFVTTKHCIDARHLFCPLPVIRVQDMIKNLPALDVVEVVCTDPGALHDVPAWCRIHGHKILTIEQAEHEITITVEVGRED